MKLCAQINHPGDSPVTRLKHSTIKIHIFSSSRPCRPATRCSALRSPQLRNPRRPAPGHKIWKCWVSNLRDTRKKWG